MGICESSPSPRVVAAAAVTKQNPRCQSPGVRAAKGKGTDFCLHPPLVPLPQWLNSEFGSCWIGVPPTSAQTSRGLFKGLPICVVPGFPVRAQNRYVRGRECSLVYVKRRSYHLAGAAAQGVRWRSPGPVPADLTPQGSPARALITCPIVVAHLGSRSAPLQKCWSPLVSVLDPCGSRWLSLSQHPEWRFCGRPVTVRVSIHGRRLSQTCIIVLNIFLF